MNLLKSHVISYRLRYWNVRRFGFEVTHDTRSHVISYRLRYWNVAWKWDCSCIRVVSHVISYRLRYWNDHAIVYSSLFFSSHVISYRLRYWNKVCTHPRDLACRVTCDLIPLAVLKHGKENIAGKYSSCHMWSHTACGIETTAELGSNRHNFIVTCDLIPLAVLKLQLRQW